jgi:putative phosphotransacetylase
VEKSVLIETSARHVHVSREALDTLFGPGYELTPKKALSQPGQFACEEKVAIVGPKGKLNASILGPVRPATQAEISLTDARAIGLSVRVRESGDVKGSPGCTIVGPLGEVAIPEGVIAARRHIHATPADAQAYGLKDRQIVQVKYDGEDRSIVFGGVVVRVHPDFALAMHIDTDESNAGCVETGAVGEILA